MIFIILLITILLPYFSQNKSLALLGSMCILFIPWGLQYEMVNDWPGNLERWEIINRYFSDDIIDDAGRNLEGIYVFLIRFFQKFGFFGWNMLSAIFELSILYLLIKSFVPPKYYWVAIFILMLRIDYGFLFINSNRQSLALFTTIFASIILCKEDLKDYFLNNIYIRLLLAIVCLFIAINIHVSAVIAFALIPIYILAKELKNFKLWLIIFINFLFFSRFVFNANVLQGTVLMYMDVFEIQEIYDSYIDLMDSELMKFSMIEQSIYFIILNAVLFMYNKFDLSIRYFALCIILSILLGGFLYGNLGRICQYYYIYMIILIPMLITTLPTMTFETIKKYSQPFYTILIIYILYSFVRDLNMDYYNGWLNFKTILSAPQWL